MAQVEFRTGFRDIPDYLATLMRGLETHTMTFEQAVQEANRAILRRHLNDTQARIVKSHMRELDGRTR